MLLVKIQPLSLLAACFYWSVLLLPVAVNAEGNVGVKADALALYSELKLADNRLPENSYTLAIYIANHQKNLAIQSVSISVNGHEAARYTYSAKEIASLLEGGLHLLSELRLPVGEHNISAKFVVMDQGAGPHADRIFPSIKHSISLISNSQQELELVPSGRFSWASKAEIKIRDRGAENSARMQSIYFNAQRDQNFEALADAITMIRRGESSTQFTAQLKQALSSSVRELGLAAVPVELRGVLAPAPQSQGQNSNTIIDQYNLGVALIQQGNVAEGIPKLVALSAEESAVDAEILLRDKINLALGFHFLKQGDSEQSITHFSQVRRLSPYANRALVGLGWAILSPRQTQVPAMAGGDQTAPGVRAKAMPYLWSGSEDDIAWARRHTPFRRAWATAYGEKAEDLQAAIVPWMELINRDPLDPAVQEGMLILPYAMSHWAGQAPRAEAYYVSAISRLEEASASLVAASEDIQRGGLRDAISAADLSSRSGWDVWLSELYNGKDAYLDLLLDSAAFHDALREYRQLTRIRAALGAYLDPVAAAKIPAELTATLTAFLPAIDGSLATWSANLDREAMAQIDSHRKRTESYLAEAVFALARNNENARRKLNDVVWDGEAK